MKKGKIPLIIFVFTLLPQILFAQNKRFIPTDFEVPKTFENQYFRIRMLTVHDVVKDYDAVMTSIDHLQDMYLPIWNWPNEELTLEQDLIDLGWHQKEFQRRRSFAFTVVSLDESQVLGCLYIDPSTKRSFDAEIYMWVRASELANNLDSILFNTVKEWIKGDWPFKNPAYPLREISLEEWNAME